MSADAAREGEGTGEGTGERTGARDGQSAGARFGDATRAVMPEDGVARVHLLRHGEVEGFERRIVRGQIDLAPTARGRAQHARLAAWLAARDAAPDLVVSSDLVRCRDLAERVATACGAELELLPALREQSMGAWEGLEWNEVSRREGARINAYWDDYFEATPTGGESMAAMFARVSALWRARCAAWTGRSVAIVTHVGPIRALLCELLGLPGTQALRFAPAIASVSEILVSAPGAVVNTLGERPWVFDPQVDAISTLDAPARRIALSGSAGTGKTTLGRRLADELGLPYVDEGMRRRLEAGLDLHALAPDGFAPLIEELWEEQCAAEDAAVRASGGFVADRSHVDYAAFWLHYGLGDDAARTRAFLERVFERARTGLDLVAVLPDGVLPLEHDGVRSTNPFVQLRFQLLVEGLLARELPAARRVRVPDTRDLDARVAAVQGAIDAANRRSASNASS